MKIDFNSIQECSYPNFKGGEMELNARMFFDGTNRIMKGRLMPGASIGLHTHEGSCEVIIIIKGQAHVIYDGERIDLREGDVHYCPEGHAHTLINNGPEDVMFWGIVPKQ